MQRFCVLIFVILALLLGYTPVKGEDKGAAYYDFGVFAYEDGDYEDAEMNFKKALELEPNNPFYMHYLGRTYVKMDRYEKAMKFYEKAQALDPDISSLRYDIAFLHYKMAKYSQASQLFSEVLEDDPSNVLAHYYAGISFFRQKKYRTAVTYLDNAAERSPTIKANGYYYAGICFLKLGDFKNAVERFQFVKDKAESKTLRDYAKSWLEAIARQRKELKPYSIYVKLSVRHDSNVQLEPDDLDIVTDQDDIVTIGFLSGRYNFVNRQDFKVGAGYSHYQSFYDDLDQFDLVGSLFNFYSRYHWKRFTFGLSYLPAYYWLEHDSFLSRHEIKPEITWKPSKKVFTTLSYSYQRDNHFQDNDRDGHTNEGFLNVYYTLGDRKGYLFGGIGYDDKTATHPDQYYTELKTKLGLALDLPWKLRFNITGRYDDQEYDNVDSFFGIQREDAKYNGTVSLSRKLLYDWLSITGEFDYTKNDSNISNFEYERRLSTLSLTARF